MIYITADSHWFHKNILRYCRRPFSSVEQMNEVMIENWNNTIDVNDIILHCGDVCLTRNFEQFKSLIQKLNGHLLLVAGNHDRLSWFQALRIPFCEFYVIDNYILTHRPLEIVPNGFVNLHGHTHKPTNGQHFNVGVDCNNFEPIKLFN